MLCRGGATLSLGGAVAPAKKKIYPLECVRKLIGTPYVGHLAPHISPFSQLKAISFRLVFSQLKAFSFRPLQFQPFILQIKQKVGPLRAFAAVQLNNYITILATPKHKKKGCSNGAIPKIFLLFATVHIYLQMCTVAQS